MPPHLVLLLPYLWALPQPLSSPLSASKASVPPAHPIKGEKNSPLGYNIPVLDFLCERELLYENDSQLCQNLVRPQATMCCFAVQFENTSKEVEKLYREKMGLYTICCEEKKEWIIPAAESGEYPQLLSLIGIFYTAYLAGNGPLFLFIQA